MLIENELKLGFKDVMIRPKRSTLKSRSQVSLERNFTFVNSQKHTEVKSLRYGILFFFTLICLIVYFFFYI